MFSDQFSNAPNAQNSTFPLGLAATSNYIEEYRRACLAALNDLATAAEWQSDRVSFLQKQINGQARSLRKIARYRVLGEFGAANRATARNLSSFACRLCGTLLQITEGKGAAEPFEPMRWRKFEALVQDSPLAGNAPDLCRIFFIKKANRKTRIITSPGPKTRAALRSVAIVLQANGISNPFEHNCKGKGPNAALESIKRAMIEEGCRWFVVFDIAKFFTSVKPDHLRWAHLPKEVLKNVVYFNQHATLIQRHKSHTSLSIGGKCHPARRGIPQGAVTSGILASALLGRELRRLSEELGTVTYVDDGVIGARSQPEAEYAAKALEKQFANLNGGPIHFKHIEVQDARQGFTFLGYWIWLVEQGEEVRVRFTPSHQSKMKFRRELHRRLKKLGGDLTWDEAMLVLEPYRRSWIAQKPLWQPSEQELINFEIETECWVDDSFNGSTKKIKPLSECGSKAGP